jgi:hypothetical protein
MEKEEYTAPLQFQPKIKTNVKALLRYIVDSPELLELQFKFQGQKDTNKVGYMHAIDCVVLLNL